MTFHMNLNFGNELDAIHDRLDAAFDSVRQDQQGQPIENVKSCSKKDSRRRTMALGSPTQS